MPPRRKLPLYLLTQRFTELLRFSEETHRALGEAAGINQVTFCRTFKGKPFGPRLKARLEQVAAHFDLPIETAFRRVR